MDVLNVKLDINCYHLVIVKSKDQFQDAKNIEVTGFAKFVPHLSLLNKMDIVYMLIVKKLMKMDIVLNVLKDLI